MTVDEKRDCDLPGTDGISGRMILMVFMEL